MKTYHKNPRQITKDQFADLKRWLEELGDLSGIVHDLNSDEIIGGNQRARVFDILRHEDAPIVITDKFDPPTRQGTVALGYIHWRGERFAYRQVRWNARQCEQGNIVANRAGGAWDWDRLANEWEVDDLLDWGFDEYDFRLAGWGDDDGNHLSVDKNAKPNPRILPLDVIYTLQGADASCCLAVRAGLKYGIQSAKYTLCPYCLRSDENHRVVFIDNDYFDYNHDVHLKAIQELRPKYATVRDVMDKKQCAVDGIQWYSLEQILDWAEELNQYAENVIVIPKYDCLDRIPEKFILGYSIPTAHGGTPLSVSSFTGRRVHLLGGSWKAQLAHLAELGDDVVSLDNNYIQLQAIKFGQAVTPEGEGYQLKSIGLEQLVNPRYVALSISFGSIAAKVNEICSSSLSKIKAVAVTRLNKTRSMLKCFVLSLSLRLTSPPKCCPILLVSKSSSWQECR